MEEAWLSGPLENVQPILMPAAHALVQARRDLEKVIPDLSQEEIWMKPNNAPSTGFHLLHIAGSIDRLLTYCRNESLNPEQFEALASESRVYDLPDLKTLKEKAVEKIQEALSVISATTENTLFEKRAVGRKNLPTSVFGLLFHIAEHTQRHVGQAITTAKIVQRS